MLPIGTINVTSQYHRTQASIRESVHAQSLACCLSAARLARAGGMHTFQWLREEGRPSRHGHAAARGAGRRGEGAVAAAHLRVCRPDRGLARGRGARTRGRHHPQAKFRRRHAGEGGPVALHHRSDFVPSGGGAFEVSLRRNDGTVYDKIGKLNFSDVRVSATTGTREVRAELPNPDGQLKPGEFVRVILKGATRPNAVTVPQRAVLEGPQGKFVYIVDEKGTAQPRPLEVGDWAGDAWIITKGVQPGDKVIVEGLMRLGPGAPVRIADANSAGKPPAQPQAPQKPEPKK